MTVNGASQAITTSASKDCCICISEMTEAREIVITRCGHSYHEECLTTYLKTPSTVSKTCPLCRHESMVPLLREQSLPPDEQETNPFIECEVVRALRELDLPKIQDIVSKDPDCTLKHYKSVATGQHRSMLSFATVTEDVAFVKSLIALTPDINMQDSDGVTPLHQATKSNKEIGVPLTLLEAGADPLLKDKDDRDVFFFAAAFGRVELAKLLLTKHGASATTKSKSSGNPLYVAVYQGHLEMVKYLTNVIPPEELKAELNHPCAQHKGTPLYVAAQRGDAAIVSHLIKMGADPNQKITQGCTPLLIAADHGHVETVRVLIAAKANVNAMQIKGLTPLYVAAKNGHREIVELLLHARASKTLGRRSSIFHRTDTPERAARHQRHYEIADFIRNFTLPSNNAH